MELFRGASMASSVSPELILLKFFYPALHNSLCGPFCPVHGFAIISSCVAEKSYSMVKRRQGIGIGGVAQQLPITVAPLSRRNTIAISFRPRKNFSSVDQASAPDLNAESATINAAWWFSRSCEPLPSRTPLMKRQIVVV